MKNRGNLLYVGDGEIELPTRWEICGCCEGHGKSSAYLGVITQSDREPGGSWDDADDFADYMRGRYDRTCEECGGSGKIEVVDVERLNPEERKLWMEQCREDAEDEAIRAAERRMGA